MTGRREVWDGLKQTIDCLREGDLEDAQGILDALAVTLPTGRLEDGAYDEFGNLYKMPEAVISDPVDVIEDSADMDSQTVLGVGDMDTLATKLEASEAGPVEFNSEDPSGEKAKEAKGKAVVERDALKVKCRLSDRGGPDVVVFLGKGQSIAALTHRIREEVAVCRLSGLAFCYSRVTNFSSRFQPMREYELHILVGSWMTDAVSPNKAGKRGMLSMR